MSSDINGFALISNTCVNILSGEKGLVLPMRNKRSLQRQWEEMCREIRSFGEKKCCLRGENSFFLSGPLYETPVNNGSQEFWHGCTCLYLFLVQLGMINKFMIGHGNAGKTIKEALRLNRLWIF